VFTPARLTLARERRGLTKKQVAEQISVSTRAMTSFEAGETTPAPLTAARLADVLRFPISFFDAQELEQIPTEAASFRSLSKMSAADRHAALAAGSLALALHDWVSDRFRLPEPDVPKLGPGIDPETAAHIVRAEWNLGEKPVSNVVHLLEARGVRVFSLAQECREVDAFSLWRSTQPFVFLNTQKSGEHSRFDAAHELGHLVLHWHHEAPQGKQPEAEANRFAAAFLMPAESLIASAPRLPDLQDLIKGKRRWKVSVAAYTHRLHELKMLTDWQYRTLFVDISQRGYRTSEPNGIQRETSQILNKVFATLRREGVSKADISSALNLYPDDLDALVFGLAMLPVASSAGIDKAASYERRQAPAQLHLVPN
jgi:Zn-dependent peptidase ImmA (M78 family)/transcriptional regulator with XRE-family HTH domain